MNSRRKFKDRALRNELTELRAERDHLRRKVDDLESQLGNLLNTVSLLQVRVDRTYGQEICSGSWPIAKSELEVPIPLTPELMEEVETRYKIGIDPAAPGADRMVEVEIQRPGP